jgi:membrane associated rhomboid family serine protease
VGSIAHTDESANMGGIAHMAHIGGFFTGFLLTFLFGGADTPNRTT